MLHGLYSSAQGAMIQSRRLDVVANNIANANTSTFKRDLPLTGTLPQFDVLLNQADPLPNGLENHLGAAAIQKVYTDFADGPLELTGDPLDVALRGPGFFRVSNGEEEFLTRDGSFTIAPTGELVTTDQNLRLLDSQGLPIEIPAAATQLAIGASGTITDLRLGPVADLQIVVPPEPPTKLGDSLYAMQEDIVAADPIATRVISGHLEASGVEPTSEMIQMVHTSRAFELNMTMLQTQDHSLGQLLDAAARV